MISIPAAGRFATQAPAVVIDADFVTLAEFFGAGQPEGRGERAASTAQDNDALRLLTLVHSDCFGNEGNGDVAYDSCRNKSRASLRSAVSNPSVNQSRVCLRVA